jgi:mono/diheme cytochrome c family protein
MKRDFFAKYAVLAFVTALFSVDQTQADSKPEYNRDVRPILNENCFACHGQDKSARKGGLRLDIREEAIKKEAFVPGDVEKSALVERIFATEKDKIMPPPKAHKKLTDAQKETLKRWIATGAEYQPHWAFIAPKRPQPPTVKDAKWVRNPIDAFVLSELEKQGLTPAPEADRRTLARRLSLDLTGLPPAPKDVETFVNDSAADAYERYVDKLLQSPQWGEHRGRYWLDAARYADSHGIHFDNYREMWTYREWVIKAFNRNLPFDQFTIEQLAGDLLPNHTLDQTIASGFNRCNITSNEGGLIPEEYLVLYTRDRTETTSKVWLGLTANCAVCHDHKFDPLTQREFYEMSSFFNNTTQGAMDGNIKDTPPVVFVPKEADRPRWTVLPGELAKANKEIDERKKVARGNFDKWLAGAKKEQFASMIPAEGIHFQAPLNEGDSKAIQLTMDGKATTVAMSGGLEWDGGHVAEKAFKSKPGGVLEAAGVGDFDKNQAFSYGAWVKLPKIQVNGSVIARMDDQHDYRGWDIWVENGRVATHIINKWPDNAVKVVTKNPVQANQWNHLFITYDGSAKAAGLRIYINGALQDLDIAADNLRDTTRTPVPFKFAQRHTGSRLDDISIQDVRIYNRVLLPTDVDHLATGTRLGWLLSKPADKISEEEKKEMFSWWLPKNDQPYQDHVAKLKSLQDEEKAIKSRGTVAHVMQEKREQPMAFVLFRGDYDKRRDQVKPGTPKILPAMPADLPRNRLGLARWLLMPEHPLTARVTVNRFWQELFGNGLVKTSEDFGVAGDLPSHPELLDWMAVEFRESGWDMKKFFKLLVTSSTYRQAATTTPEKLEKDAQNRLLSRGPRFRMDAEMVRDYALAASGLLVKKIGGPSVKPYQPDGVWEAVAMIGSDTRDYRRDSGDSLYRRSLYTFWKRAAPPASMDIFNAPTRETCTVRRDRTNTPLQALVTLNDPQFVEAARHLAETTLKGSSDKPEDRIDFMARRLLARPLNADEAKIVAATINDLLDYYKAHHEDAKKLVAFGESKSEPTMDVASLAAYTMLANQLMNLDEVLNK